MWGNEYWNYAEIVTSCNVYSAEPNLKFGRICPILKDLDAKSEQSNYPLWFGISIQMSKLIWTYSDPP